MRRSLARRFRVTGRKLSPTIAAMFLAALWIGGCDTGDTPLISESTVVCASGDLCSRTAVEVSGGRLYTQVAAGGEHSCALTNDGTAWCWGSNVSGQLGNGSREEMSVEPSAVAGALRFTSLSAGATHTCALTIEGIAYCWGRGEDGILGTGLLTDSCRDVPCSREPVRVIGGRRFASVEAGYNHTCAVDIGGTAFCWGGNRYGQLGTGSYFAGSSLPETVDGLTGISSVTTGFRFSCAVTASGDARCWGFGRSDALGSVPDTYCPQAQLASRCAPSPRSVSGGVSLISTSAGDNHACGISNSGAVYCWGENTFGQIGVNADGRMPIPSRVPLNEAALQVSAGASHSCAVLLSGALACWGTNASGETGLGRQDLSIAVPTILPGARNYAMVSAGGNGESNHTCALTGLGVVSCWGSNRMGQLGIR